MNQLPNNALRVLAMLALAVGAAACAQPEPTTEAPAEPAEVEADAAESEAADAATEGEHPLAGTYWTLAQFQAMDDSVGTSTPEDPALYTMALNADGTVNMRLNCNRANGNWSAEAAADSSSGTFGFGMLATTRALCSPPSMDEKIAADAQWVRSYLLKDGQLHLSLMADGGIYSWDPAAPPPADGE